jgi:glycosyltransferase involved in cell wall biosynthesis
MNPSVSVIIPTHNEAGNIGWVLDNMPSVHEVILVDNSTDNTWLVAKEHYDDIKIVGQSRRGKGNALVTGFKQATGDIIIMLDGDGSADPREIKRFVAALMNDGVDFAKGTRFSAGGGSDDITKTRHFGNWCLNKVVNGMFGSSYSDLCYGYNAFWRYCLDDLKLPNPYSPGAQWGDGFEIETMINTRLVGSHLIVEEVPSYEYNRITGESNLKPVKDGTRVLKTIMREKRSR